MIKSGICGTNVEWKLDLESGKMVISGQGPMTDYEAPGEAPWNEYCGQIRELVLEDGVTSLGDYAFIGCDKLEHFELASSVEELGAYSLSACTSLTEAVLPEGLKVIGAKAFSAVGSLKKVHIPLTVKAIDMKAFEMNPDIEEVTYPGTMEQWKQIRISMNANGNKYLLAAYAKDEPASTWNCFYRFQERKVPIFGTAKKIIEQGGDGRFHILTVQLTTFGIPGKPGDCTLLIFPDGKIMMIDAGVPYAEEKVMDALHELELKSLDYFMTSHPHLDHVGNALAVAKYIYGQGGTIGTYFHSGHVFKDLEPEFSAYLQEQGTNMDNHLTRGESRQIGDVQMEVLRPTKQMLIDGKDLQGDAVNTLSLTVKFTFGKVSYLTGGDLYRRDEREAVNTYGDHLKSTVLKASHHGVYTSNSKEWIETVSPDVILVNSDDIGGTFLEKKAAEMGIAYFSSGLDGSMLVSMSKDGELEVQTGYGRTFHKTV